eukprot:5625-Heterococcus_DN1.PRE.2
MKDVSRVQGDIVYVIVCSSKEAQLCVCTECGQCQHQRNSVQSDVLCWRRQLVSIPVYREATHNSTASVYEQLCRCSAVLAVDAALRVLH